jgi:hypothetical protein
MAADISIVFYANFAKNVLAQFQSPFIVSSRSRDDERRKRKNAMMTLLIRKTIAGSRVNEKIESLQEILFEKTKQE